MQNEDDEDDFLFAARTGDRQHVEAITTRFPRIIDSADDHGNTALHFACANGQTETLSYLLSFYSTTAQDLARRTNEAGNTPIHWASLNGHLDIVTMLTALDKQLLLARNLAHQTPGQMAEDAERWQVCTYITEQLLHDPSANKYAAEAEQQHRGQVNEDSSSDVTEVSD